MTDEPTKQPRFWAELLRRRVFRATAAYLVAALFVLEAGNTIADVMNLPDWVMQVVAIVLAFGLVVAIVLAWLYKWTPAGVEREAPKGGELASEKPVGNVFDFLVVVLSVGIFFFLAWYLYNRNATSPVEPDRPTLAVLPFEGLGKDPNARFFGRGLSEEVIALLSRVEEIDVITHDASSQFASFEELRDTGAFNSVAILSGSVSRIGGRLRIHARLSAGTDGVLLWSERFDRANIHIFEVQEEIAQAITAAMAVTLSSASRHSLKQTPTQSTDAFDAVLLARGRLRVATTMDQLAAAKHLFQEAIRQDPTYADAHAGVCETFLAMYRISVNSDDFRSAQTACLTAGAYASVTADTSVALGQLHLTSGDATTALRHFDNALMTRPNFVSALVGRADALAKLRRFDEAQNVYLAAAEESPSYWRVPYRLGAMYLSRGQFDKAANRFMEAVVLKPRFAAGYNALGAARYYMGEFGLAAQAWEKSLSIEPDAQAYSNTGTMYFYVGNFERALALYKDAARVASDDHTFRGHIGDALKALGRDELADEAYRQATLLAEERLSINPNDPTTLSRLAHYLASSGDTARVEELLNKALEAGPENAYVHYDAALVHVLQGDFERAVAHLERAVALGYLPTNLPVDPALAPLRQRDDFVAISQQR